MNILVIGSGGREHALCVAVKKSPQCKALYCIPGNAGIAEVAECENIRVTDFDAIIEFCREKLINFAIIGPEAPLVEGIAEFLEDRGVKVFGPNSKAAQLEASKTFTKDICERGNIPTAKAANFTKAEEAKNYIREHGAPIVVKADGLAAGKGVIVAEDVQTALDAIDDIMVEKSFGEAGNSVLIEDFLTGREASFFAVINNGKVFEFGTACDYKRVGDGNTGLNTGGMGTYSPADNIDDTMKAKIMDEVIYPTLKVLEEDGIKYKGFLFAGLMIDNGIPKLIEYNCRMGDPETQSILPRLQNDIIDVMLGLEEPKFSDENALTIVYAAAGYPGKYEKHTEITDLDKVQDAFVYHAGTSFHDEKIVSIGGRVLGITALGNSLENAKKKAYDEIAKISWPKGFYRKDIGKIYG